jgi:hypothetical protein
VGKVSAEGAAGFDWKSRVSISDLARSLVPPASSLRITCASCQIPPTAAQKRPRLIADTFRGTDAACER